MKDYDMQKELGRIEQVIAKGPYRDDWESLSAYEVPGWYKRLRFGIFIHYGLFSVPAYDTEWYPRMMYVKDSKAYEHHIKTYGEHTRFGLKDFIPMFKAEKFDAVRWVSVFKAAGAQYVIPVAEHHDGFQMYGSDLSSYNAVDMGPHRDILGEIRENAEKEGLIFGASSHRMEHYFFLGEGRDFDSDIKGDFKRGDMYWPSVKGPKDFDACEGECSPGDEFMFDWLVRTCELIDKYRPKILYFDWWIQRVELKPYLKKLIAYYYNRADEWGQQAVINYKHDAIPFGIAVPDVERGQFSSAKPYRWQSDTAMCFNSWCHTVNNRYKEAKDILCDLIDIVSKNGTMLLNIGPKADGTFTGEETDILAAIGSWISRNREALFDSYPYRIYGEGPTEVTEGGFSDGKVKEFTSGDFRFLAGNGCIYVIALRPDRDGEYRVLNFAKKQGAFNTAIKSVSRPGYEDKVAFDHTAEGLIIRCSTDDDMPVVFRIETE
ncbi:MAG: alpha-L-fucosidase [Lachnospiraceae bacterium]|nr:alpha-L-fucosidase [Lachnospiraceae bacterium]